MSDETKRELPYRTLGSRLKRLRQKLQESLAEVSGAVEIDVEMLNGYEAGEIRPSEDILALLISHFNVRDEEAKKIWALAGYSEREMSQDQRDDDATVPSVVVLPMDVRVAYTDMVNVMVNDYGVTLNFMQSSGPNNQPMVVSRLGMSKEHAKSVIEVLQKTLAQQEPKSLPLPDKQNDTSETNDTN